MMELFNCYFLNEAEAHLINIKKNTNKLNVVS